jgi:hypothetical protein
MTRPYITPSGFQFWSRRDYEAAMAAEGRPLLPKIDLDPAERLQNLAASSGPKVSWGSMAATEENARRRKVDIALERLGLKPPLRW